MGVFVIRAYKLVICGGGPAGISPLVSLHERGLLDDLLDQGVCIIEASSKIGSGSISNYQITANSLGKIFFEVFNEVESSLLKFLKKKESYYELCKYNESAPPLPIVGQFLEDIGDYISSRVKSSLKSNVLKLTKVTSIKVREDGLYEITYSSIFHPFLKETVIAEKVFFNLGGDQQKHYNKFSEELNVPLINSGEFIKGVYDNKLTDLLEKGENSTITLVGGSHSTFSTLYRFKNHFHILNNDLYTINILHRKPIKLFYNSTDEAMLDNYNFSKMDVCPASDRVNRYSGLRYDSFNLAKEVFENKYSNVYLKELEEIRQDDLKDSNLIIECTGYTSRSVPLLDKNSKPLEFSYQDNKIKINEFCNPILSNGKELKGFYQFGLGAGLSTGGNNFGEKSYKGRIDGVWVYQHLVTEKMLSQNLFYENDLIEISNK